LSHDEIVFDDVKYREPERRCRPDRDRQWTCMAYEVPGPSDLPIFLELETADAIERHALRDTTVELGGILLGKECVDEQTRQPFVLVTRWLEAKHYENTQASFTYTHDSWEEITRERDRRYPDLDIVGWYHTHPDFGIFLSGHDQFLHRNFFAQPLQVAYVIDPIRQTRGFFHWRGEGLEQVSGYYLFADRGARIALSRFVNDLENIPSADGAGGSLSPRLEAELIAMLTRPAPSQLTPADRAQVAALFSLVGGIAGALLLAAVLWLHGVYQNMNAQAAAIAELRAATGEALAQHRLALDSLVADNGRVPPEKFVAQYDLVARQRDQFRRESEDNKTSSAALAEKLRAVEKDNADLKKKIEASRKYVDLYNRELHDEPNLISRLGTLNDENDRQGRKIKELEELLDSTTDGQKARALQQRYERTWWTAAAGWGLSLLTVLGLAAMVAQGKVLDRPDGESPTDEPAPHRID
jgi:proteasome lid subunit RPN8/RPN11